MSPLPGFTKAMQEIQLDKKVKLLDCPGIIFDTEGSEAATGALLLKNCISVADMEDPEVCGVCGTAWHLTPCHP